MYRDPNITDIEVDSVHFESRWRMIHTFLKGKRDGYTVGWCETETIRDDKEWFERKLKGK